MRKFSWRGEQEYKNKPTRTIYRKEKKTKQTTTTKKKVARVRDFSLIVLCLYIRGVKSKDLRKKKKREREIEKTQQQHDKHCC